MSFKIVSKTLSADLVAGGTTTFGYPTGTDEDSFAGFGHVAVAIGNVMNSPDDFTLTFGSASVTFTYAASKTTVPAGGKISLQLNLAGERDKVPLATVDYPGVALMATVRVDLGSPLAIDVNGIFEAFSGAAGTIPLDGALATSTVLVDLTAGAGGAPYGRNVIADSGGADTAVLTITGADYLGNAMSEAITLNGLTAVSGKKAFATITNVTSSATISNGAFLGTGDLLGLPVYVPGVDNVLLELEDNVAATAGAFVAGVDALATTTTGDVRGTYDPNSATDGAANFVVVLALTDPAYTGVTQA